ncbi:MAG: TorF family putative porin [Bdellovibrio sp.]
MRRSIAFIIIILTTAHLSLAAEGDASTSSKLYGDVSLLSHYVQNGLSQTDKAPALQASFWYNFVPQFRLGLWGSNVYYQNSNDNFNLRINSDVRVDFTSNFHAFLSYTHSEYYNSGNHSGGIFGIRLNFSNYRILYNSYSNWEATEKSAKRFAFGVVSNVFTNWKWDNEAGYNTTEVTSIQPYFDFRSGLGFQWSSVFLEGAITGTSSSSQFNGRGDYFFILSAKMEL